MFAVVVLFGFFAIKTFGIETRRLTLEEVSP
jgi:hypothetical protein